MQILRSSVSAVRFYGFQPWLSKQLCDIRYRLLACDRYCICALARAFAQCSVCSLAVFMIVSGGCSVCCIVLHFLLRTSPCSTGLLLPRLTGASTSFCCFLFAVVGGGGVEPGGELHSGYTRGKGRSDTRWALLVQPPEEKALKGKAQNYERKREA